MTPKFNFITKVLMRNYHQYCFGFNYSAYCWSFIHLII